MTAIQWLQWAACCLGVLGALFIASRSRLTPWGFAACLASSLLWAVYALECGVEGLLLQQIAFGCTSLLGIYRWRHELRAPANAGLPGLRGLRTMPVPLKKEE